MLLFSIVTPSFNQARYLEDTLSSISRQTYNNYEHIILDPGSDDGSIEIIGRYQKENGSKVKSFIGEDKSQTNAINIGFSRAEGEILCWLNSDDSYFDDAVLSSVQDVFSEHPDVDVVYGEGEFIDPSGSKIKDAFINSAPEKLTDRFLVSLGILQPSLFLRRRAFEKAGPLDESMNFSFDYEYWVRLLNAGCRFFYFPKTLSKAVIHDEAKTMAQRDISLEECAAVAKRYYGFVPKEWADRIKAFEQSGADGILAAGSSEMTADEYINLHGNAGAMLTWAHLPSAASSLDCLDSNAGIDLAKFVVTCFDQHYFDQGMTLISSLHQYAAGTTIIVYDNGLSNNQRALLEASENVIVLNIPANLIPGAWYTQPKNYVYKNLIAYHATTYAKEGAEILWIDAGVALRENISALFALFRRQSAFFVDHDDRPLWPFYNASFATDDCLVEIGASYAEAAAPHICSCLFGFVNNAKNRKIFRESYDLSCNEKISLGEKHPVSKINPSSELSSERDSFLEIGDEYIAEKNLPDIRSTFGFLGHRQDQTIFSILAKRHEIPVVSAKQYCRASDASSRKSQLNHSSGTADRSMAHSRTVNGDYEQSVTVHHRGLFINFDHFRLSGAVLGDACAVIGNGPSLKGFDLRRLGRMPTIGMNAAYRHWERIGWYPTYYACLDLIVGESHRDAILDMIRRRDELEISLFVLRAPLVDWLSRQTDIDCVIDFDAIREGVDVLAAEPITTGSHSASFASFLGHKRVYLLGIDCKYEERVPGSEIVEGRVLEIKSLDKNPNYFFDDYQRPGDQYNFPNPNPDLHVRAWKNVAPLITDNDSIVYNTNIQSAVDFFESSSVTDFLRKEVEISRDAHARVDETAVVAELLRSRKGRQHVMIDVGAHFGGSAARFDELDWTIHCFEPDPANRAKLVGLFSKNENVTIDARAVSDKPLKDVSFFKSDESTGISGLHAFRDTHREEGKVDLTTVAEIIDDRGLSKIDFLKIDVEGFDFNVLKGVPWDQLRPDVIECEFEDSKTTYMGHCWHDIAEYLHVRDYAVYISEWHPIIRYGIAHDWKCVVPYPGVDVPTESWGNMLAFREDPGYSAVLAAFEKLTKIHPDATAIQSAAQKPSEKSTQMPETEPVISPAEQPKALSGKQRSRRAARWAKLKRDPRAFFRDSYIPPLRPLQHLFRPTSRAQGDVKAEKQARRAVGGRLSFLPASRKALAAEHFATRDALQREIEAMAAGREKLAAKIADMEATASKHDTTLESLKAQLTSQTNEIETLNERADNLVQSTHTDLKASHLSLGQRFGAEIAERLEPLQADFEARLKETALGEEALREAIAAGREKLAAKIADMEATASKHDTTLESLEAQLTSQTNKIETLNERADNLVQSTQVDLKALRLNFEQRFVAEFEGVLSAVQAREKEESDNHAKYKDETKKQLDSVNRRHTSTHNDLKDLQKKYEALLKEKDQQEKLLTAVADEIDALVKSGQSSEKAITKKG